MDETKSLINSLEALHSQCKGSLAICDKTIDGDRGRFIETQLDKLVSGIENAEMLLEFMAYVDFVRNEKQGMRLQIKRLNEENDWLRNEVADIQNKLQLSEQSVAEFEEKQKALEYWNSVHTFEQRLARQLSEEELAKNASIIEVALTQNDLIKCIELAENAQKETITDKQINSKSESNSSTICLEICEDSDSSTESASAKVAAKNNQNRRTDAKVNHNYDDTNPLTIIRCLHNLTLYYSTQKQFDLAMPISREAITKMEAYYGREHPDVAIILTVQAVMHNDVGEFKESVKLLKESLAIRLKLLGERHPFVMASLNNLAATLNKSGDLEEAVIYSRQALAIREKVLGASHPDVAKQLSNLCVIYGRLNDHEKAIKCCQRALKIYSRNLSSDHGCVIHAKYQLALHFIRDRQFSNAQRLLIQVIKTLYKLNRLELDNNPMGVYYDIGNWHTVDKFKIPSLTKAAKNLIYVYRSLGNDKSAQGIQDWVNQQAGKTLTST